MLGGQKVAHVSELRLPGGWIDVLGVKDAVTYTTLTVSINESFIPTWFEPSSPLPQSPASPGLFMVFV